MMQSSSLLAESSDTDWSFEKATPFSSANACYRSRIYTANVGINPLIAACDQLFSLATILASAKYPDDRDKLLQDLAHEIRSFEHQAQIANYQNNTIVAARFAICCLLDETIKSTKWGEENNWYENNLLTLFHNEDCGDTRFFTIIDRALENITANLHLIELIYLCLTLGTANHGSEELSEEQNEITATINKLHQIITQHNKHKHKNLLVQDKKVKTEQEIQKNIIEQKSKNDVSPAKLIWTTTILAFVVSGIIYTGANLKLNSISEPTHSTIKQITKNKSKN